MSYEEDMAPIPEEGVMPRIIVTTDPLTTESAEKQEASVLLDERVNSLHLSDDHAADQLIERLAWAVTDAEDAQRDLATH